MSETYCTDEDFIKRGYKKYSKTPFDSESVMYNFQKRFDNENGKKYFIDIRKIDNRWMEDKYVNKSWYRPFTYEYSCQLYKKETHDALDIDFHSSWTIEQVENFVEKLFQDGLLDYYETWEGTRDGQD